MKRLGILFIVVLMGAVILAAGVLAADFPSNTPDSKASPPLSQGEIRQRMFYGYVPPAPIHHTWPGGYRVIFHELMNTLSEHILGQY
jgi:hypothetical protein